MLILTRLLQVDIQVYEAKGQAVPPNNAVMVSELQASSSPSEESGWLTQLYNENWNGVHERGGAGL